MKGHLDVKELEKCKKADLQKLAEELGVSTEGTIKELAERCAEVEVEIPDESELTEEETIARGMSSRVSACVGRVTVCRRRAKAQPIQEGRENDDQRQERQTTPENI